MTKKSIQTQKRRKKGRKREKKKRKKKRGEKRKKGEKKRKKEDILWNCVTHPKAGTKKFGRVERSAAERAGRIFSEKLCSF
jgi:hypothetical protein